MTYTLSCTGPEVIGIFFFWVIGINAFAGFVSNFVSYLIFKWRWRKSQ